MMDRPAGLKMLELCGFKEEMTSAGAYLVMKVGNLNIPWLTVVNKHLDSLLE